MSYCEILERSHRSNLFHSIPFEIDSIRFNTNWFGQVKCGDRTIIMMIDELKQMIIIIIINNTIAFERFSKMKKHITVWNTQMFENTVYDELLCKFYVKLCPKINEKTNGYVYRGIECHEQRNWHRKKKSINIRFKPATVTDYGIGICNHTENESIHRKNKNETKERKTKADQLDLSLNDLMVEQKKLQCDQKWKCPKFSFSFVKRNHFSFRVHYSLIVNHTLAFFLRLINENEKKKIAANRNSSQDKLPGALHIILIVCSTNSVDYLNDSTTDNLFFLQQNQISKSLPFFFLFPSIYSYLHFTFHHFQNKKKNYTVARFTEFLFIIRPPFWWLACGWTWYMSALCDFVLSSFYFHYKLWKLDSIINYYYYFKNYRLFAYLTLRDNQTAATRQIGEVGSFFRKFDVKSILIQMWFFIGVFLAMKFDFKRNKILNCSFVYEWQLLKNDRAASLR